MNKQPIAIWITDCHLEDKTIDVNLSVYEQVLNLCVQHQVPLINGGDVFTSRRGQSEQVLTTFSKILSSFSEAEVKFFCLSGNHDKSSLVSPDSFLNPFSGWHCFHLYREYDYSDYKEVGIRFHFIPYFDEKLSYRQYLDQAIKNIRFDFKNILFTHIAISGVSNNDGSKIQNEIEAGLFKHFHKVLVGHYHERQIFSNNIIYTGSAYQANFGENDQKGCTVIYSDGSTEFIQLDFPRYITIEKKNEEQIVHAMHGYNVRVKFKYKPTEAEIQHLQLQGIKTEIDYQQELINHTQDVKTQFSSQDIVEYFNLWCEEKEIDQQEKQFGLKLLEQ